MDLVNSTSALLVRGSFDAAKARSLFCWLKSQHREEATTTTRSLLIETEEHPQRPFYYRRAIGAEATSA